MLALLGSGCVVGAPAKSKNAPIPITTREERQKWLNICQDFSQNKKTDITEEDVSLFLYIKEDKPIVEKIQEEKPIKVKPYGINELMLLKNVGNAIKPKGRVQVDEEFILCIQNARTLKKGEQFTAENKGKKFLITVKDISKDQFVLQLDSYSLTFKY